jgi:hypothetical protein
MITSWMLEELPRFLVICVVDGNDELVLEVQDQKISI